MDHNLLTLKDVAKKLGVSYPRAAELARTGAFPVVKLFRQVRVAPRHLDEFVERGGASLPGGWRREAR
jgi:hypothetical protein